MDIADIQTKAHEIIGAWTEKLNSGKSFPDLMQVYGDIRVELSRKAPDSESLIDDYTELMFKEQKMCSPEAVYKAGYEAAQSGHEYKLAGYIGEVLSDSENQELLTERDKMFHTLCGLVDEHLMDEYTELFRYCHGEINQKIEQFYHWGYYGIMPDIKTKAG